MNSVHAATTSGPPTAVIGLSLRLKAKATSDAVPTAISTGTSDSSDRMTLRSRTLRKRNTNRMARYVSSTRLASRLSSRPTPTTARPDGVALTPAGGCVVERISRTTAARACERRWDRSGR